MTGLLPERLQYGLVCCCLPSQERSRQILVKLFSSMSCPYKMTGPFRNPTKWVAVLIFLLHMLQKVLLQTAQDIVASIYTFSVPPSFPYKVRGPRRNSYNMVLCFIVISCAYSHIAEDTPREVLRNKFESKSYLVFVWCVYSHVPIMPYHAPTKWQVSFQAPTRWVGIVVLLFPSKMQLKILYCSKLFGFLWCLPKSIDTHTENNMITC